MYAYSRIEYEDEMRNEFIENEMQRTKEFTLRKLSSIAHFKTKSSSQSFITMFVYCWQESLPEAQNLANELDLCKLDFLALMEDFEGFKEEYLNNHKEAQNF